MASDDADFNAYMDLAEIGATIPSTMTGDDSPTEHPPGRSGPAPPSLMEDVNDDRS
jgi:hypothetical protein